MTKGRLEAFSAAVLGIIITIMVLELRILQGKIFQDLKLLFFKFLSYILSFMDVGISWNNHQHLFQAMKHANGKVFWANLHLLFWLSILPFATFWMGENHFTKNSVAVYFLYGFILLMYALAFNILQKLCLDPKGKYSVIANAHFYRQRKTFGSDLYLQNFTFFCVSGYCGGALLHCGTIMDYPRC